MLLRIFEELMPEYRQYNLTKKNVEEITYKTYILYAEKFFEYLDNEYINPPKKLEYINDSHVFDFLKYKEKKDNVNARSLDRYYRIIRYYFEFLYVKRHIKSPILPETNPKICTDYKLKRSDFLSIEELKKVIQVSKDIYNREGSFLSHRNYIIILLLSYTGITVNELLSLKEKDISFSFNRIYICGKRQRKLHLNNSIGNLLNEYILHKNEYMITEYLFPARYNKKLNIRTAQRVVTSMAQESGLNTKERTISPKTIRNTVIKIMIEEKWDMIVAAKITGLDVASLTEYLDEDVDEIDIKVANYFENHPILK